MIEDKLNPSERIRLEALAQAVASSGAAAGRIQAADDVVRRASIFADFIITGKAKS